LKKYIILPGIGRVARALGRDPNAFARLVRAHVREILEKIPEEVIVEIILKGGG